MTAAMMACPSCQGSNPTGAQFCGSCGFQLMASTALGAAPPVGVAYAGFWIRFLAYIIDGFILAVPNIIIQVLVKDAVPVFMFQLGLGALYAIGFWVMEGATPGKMALGLKVTTVEGQPVEFGTAALRYFGYFVSFITLLIGFIMIGFSEQKRGLHDQIAGTIVVRTRA